MTDLSFTEFIPARVSRDEWTRYHAFRKKRHDIIDPEEPLVPDDVVEKDLMFHDPLRERIRALVVDGADVVASARLSRILPVAADYEENKHIATMWVEVLPEYQRRGIGTSWARRAAEYMEQHTMTILDAFTFEDSGHAFLKKLGGEAKMVEQQNRLYLTDVDWDMARDWIEDAQRRSPDTTVEVYADSLPRDIWDEYLPVYTEIHNDMPLEELEAGAEVYDIARWTEIDKWMREIGAEHHTMLTREPDGSISGLTDVLYQPATPVKVHQWATGVVRKHRGRRIGRWLKASMLLYLKDRYPELRWVDTENAHSNDPMLAINHALGFKLHREIVVYQVGLDRLNKAVAAGA